MSLIKNSNIDIKNSCLALAIASGLALGLSGLVTAPVFASNTNVKAQVCQGGQTTVSLVSTTPDNNATVIKSNLNYVVRTNWATRLVVRLNGTQVYDQPVAYQAGVDTTVPLAGLLPEPQTNQIELEITGGCPDATITQQRSLKFKADILTFNKTNTKIRSPELKGEINDPNLEVHVYIEGRPGFFRAINHGNGTWTLPAGTIAPELADGTYKVTVKSYDPNTSSVVLTKVFPNGLVIDNVPPVTDFNPKDEYDERSPELSGTVNEPDANVTVEINGKQYPAVNNQDGTWTLPQGTIDQLANGSYDLTITATDPAGNKTIIRKTIRINAKNNLGFFLPPNTGYLRIGRVNIPSWFIYLLLIIGLGSLIINRKKKATNN